MTIYGIDASNHQGNQSSLGGVAASFYAHKLTEGTTYIDPYASRNLAWAKQQGITLRGGYHFIRKGNGSGQASFFIAQATRLFGANLRGFLWQLDCESDASLQDIADFKHRWDQVTGSAPIFFYTGDWWLEPRGWNIAALGFVGLWSAPNRGYVGKANAVRSGDWTANYGGFSRIAIVQYDARPAIGDTNQFNGSLAQLKALCAGSPASDSTSKETDAMQLVETSLSMTRPTKLTPGTALVINWDQENTDPAHQHADTTKARPQGYPGFVPAFAAYVNGTATLRLTGHEPGDMLQVRLIKNDWDTKTGKAKPNPGVEVLYDGPMSTGTHWANFPLRAYATAGQHWYLDVCVYPPAGQTAIKRPDLTLAAATWRLWQMRK